MGRSDENAYRKTRINDHEIRPESLMMGYGYRPEWSEGALKCPLFQTSTFVFETAEEGPGDVLLRSEPLQGGTGHLLPHFLPQFGIRAVGFQAGAGAEAVEEAVEEAVAAPDVAETLAMV